ncbi:MAG: aspartate 1-decarboxylase [Archangium sp.]|nr:aspartate 1-decarboxylase [Archangium sp.]
MKALRLVLLGEIHSAVVTTVDFDEADGLRLDPELLDAAGFVEHEKVEVYDLSTGSRLSCQVRRGKSGEVGLCGAAALLIKPGERITVASFGWMKEKAALKHQPRVLRVDDDNHLIPAKKSKAG